MEYKGNGRENGDSYSIMGFLIGIIVGIPIVRPLKGGGSLIMCLH